jgi:predicted Zn-dependent protease with MMP-like domain
VLAKMEREKFEALVTRVIENLPPEFENKLDNVDVVVEDWPSPMQLRNVKLRHPSQLLGLYEGVPQTRRGGGYGMVLPDKISIFQKPIEAQCRLGEDIEAKIREVVCHEIAHHFGTDERTLQRIEGKRRKKEGG